MMTSTLITLSPEELDQRIITAVHLALSLYKPTSTEPLTPDQVAQKLNLSVRTIKRFISEGRKTRKGKVIRLPAHEITTNRYIIRPDELDEWLLNF